MGNENLAKTNINWYPGHMSKAKRQMQEELKLVDVIVELVDARIPYSSKNPDIDKLAGSKPRVLLLNKADLADEGRTKEYKAYYEKRGYYVLAVNAKTGAGMKSVLGVIKEACKEKRERDLKRGIIGRPLRAMIAGIPNVGKSTFINSFAGKACAKTGNKPGVTKGKQWIRLNKSLELLDTPGILWPKFEDQDVGMKLAFIGSMNDEILNIEELSLLLIQRLKTNYKGILEKRYDVNEEEDDIKVLEDTARTRNCFKKGSELDLQKAAALIMDDFRSGRLGRITLERVKEQDVE